MLVVLPDSKAAKTMARELRFFLGEDPDEGDPHGGLDWVGPSRVLEIPEIEVHPYLGLSPDRREVMGLIEALVVLANPELEPRPRFVVVPAPALARKVMPARDLTRRTMWLGIGDEIDREGLLRDLAAMGYTRVRLVEERGGFSARGGTIDVFGPLYRWPVRIELWDDEIETIRFFDPDGQRSLGATDMVVLPPAREELTFRENLDQARERILDAVERLDLPSSRASQILADLSSGIYFFGVEALLPAFFPHLEDLQGYLPGVAVVVEPDDTLHQVELLHEAMARAHQGRVEAGRLAFEPSWHFTSPEEVEASLSARTRVTIGGLAALGAGGERRSLGASRGFGAVADDRRSLAVFGRWVHQHLESGYSVGLVVASRGRAERVRELVKPQGFRVVVADRPGARVTRPGALPLERGVLNLLVGELGGGFVVPVHSLALATDEEVFGERAHRRPRKRRKVTEGLLAAFQELSEGDLVVHRDHGVGRYRSLVKLQVGGVEKDYLLIEYKGGDKLYLPVERLDQISRYVASRGQTDHAPALDKLGGTGWKRTRKRVERNVEKLARELLEIHAKRKANPGIAFSPPDEYYRLLEARFPFEETPDQARAIDAVIQSMLRPECMDHLVCGDVGYGKTEVAMRAAFLAVESGYQVAVLCPTTVLAAQHLETFRARYGELPVRVEGLSRFTPARQARRIIEDTRKGSVDVLIGTHRILGKDVGFARLGLVIVDEEQRFGVKQKERLKELRTQVDVLTLTATPIPRTLHMAMSGLKEISIIATPPVDRQAIRTFVTQYDPQVIREAIIQELSRGGQVFYVHNRVRTLGRVHEELEALVPEARIGVAHGQMPGHEVEEVMLSFVEGETNLLLSTAIIESGLDIPRANTMIVDDAHTFGLAQLYQLRGRIGRSKERAFAYLIVPPRRAMTEAAVQRVEALQRFTELGAGFQIATLDLEIRGAGDILGPEQSGNVDAVGFELYTKMLEDAVSELSGEQRRVEVEPEIKLPVSARIPDEYVPDMGMKLGLYKRLSRAASLDEAGEIYEEVVDRFGRPPREFTSLVRVMEIKILARLIGAHKVEWSGQRLAIHLGPEPILDPRVVLELLEEPGSPWRLSREMVLSIPVARDEDQGLFDTRQALLRLVERATQARVGVATR